MDYDMISKMMVEELKMYLRLRGLKLSGRKEGWLREFSLLPRKFAAAEKVLNK